jgi:uracil-DNA glycosylase
MKFAMPNRWENFAFNEQNKEYLLSLKLRLKEELISGKKIYPPEKEIFKAFELTAPENTKVVILGQDPYHNFNQANGLCFSVNKKQLLPPSLKNIFKELEDDLGIKNYKHGDLSSWAKQGVLLMNTSLTVEKGNLVRI